VEARAFDVAIVGAGPNGLTAGAYLARAGARVVLLEKRFERGGTFATDDYSTPFQYNLAQFELPFGRETPPFRDLDLGEQGVRFVEPELPFAARVEPRGEELVVGRGGRGLGAEVERMLDATSNAVAPLLYAPPKGDGALETGGEHRGAAEALARTTPRELAGHVADPRAAVILRYACGLAGFLDADSPLGLIGAFAVARLFQPTVVVGGTKNLANGLFRAAASAGARGLVDTEIVDVRRGQAGYFLRTADQREISARTVISTLEPRSTFVGILDSELVPTELQDVGREWRSEPTGPFTAHYGIKGHPPGPVAEGGDALVRIFGFAAPADVEAHFESALAGELAARPAGHLTVVTAHDPLQASPGPFGPLHTLRAQTIVPFEHPHGAWDAHRRGYRHDCWDTLVAHFRRLEDAQPLFQFCDTPLDIERRFGTTRRGSVRQGALSPEQTLRRRPHPSCSTGRTPIDGFYLGGGAVHPGVPGTLGGGYNVAAAVAEDLGLERWWPEAGGGVATDRPPDGAGPADRADLA
jgi:phytoene dehydrogenase-like protein